jgi:hypothetical protein
MLRKILLSILAIVLPVLLPAAFTATARGAVSRPECWAVIVGISEYIYEADLLYAADDATDLAQSLSPAWGQDHARLLLDHQATKGTIMTALDWLIEHEDADDTVLFFFSGHGYHGGYLAPADAYYQEKGISPGELDAKLRLLDSRRVVVVLDTCYAGAFASLGTSGRLVLMSSGGDEDSNESIYLEHGIFTDCVLQALENFNLADTNRDYQLSGEEVMAYSRTRMTQYAPTQHPVLADGDTAELGLLDRFVFTTKLEKPYSIDVLRVDDWVYTSPRLWVPNTGHNLSLIAQVDTGKGTRYVFTTWSDGITSPSREIRHGGEYEAYYNTEHRLTINSAFGAPVGAGWYIAGAPAGISVASVDEPTVRHICTGWSGDITGTEAAASLTMDAPKTVTANWRTDYLVTVGSAYGQPGGAGWYGEGSTATISVNPIQGIIIRQIFAGWSGDFIATEATDVVTVDAAKYILATWRTDYIQFYILVAGFVVLLVVVLGLVLKRRH